MERQRASTALAATIRISEMMCKSLADLHRSMVAPYIESSKGEESELDSQESATVLGFPGFVRDESDDPVR